MATRRRFSTRSTGGAIVLALGCAVLTVGLTAYRAELFHALRHVDKHYLQETLKDWRARLVYDEDWSGAARDAGYDYDWLPEGQQPAWIAHGLGGDPGPNTLAAYSAAVDKGFVLFEVDLWLDRAGRLRCHHGPGRPPAYTGSGCTLSGLVERLDASHHLVLDLKTDFRETGNAVLETVPESRHANLIFQLYRPEHIDLFSTWSRRSELPGPVVTAYRGQRGVNHVLGAVERAGYRVLTVPLERAPALRQDRAGIRVWVHPVANCTDVAVGRQYGATGFYAKTILTCDG